MRILLTNDDGIHAEGLAVLHRIAQELTDDVWIVAPETDQSGLAHSLTLSEPLRLRRVADKHFALRGTPTDCVIMAVKNLMDSPPDLVLSGVNSGPNVADDVTYSGTVAGAMEGTLLGIRSFALSQHYAWDNGRIVPWEVVLRHAPRLIDRLIQMDMPKGRLLNLNFPNCLPEAVKGYAVTDQGQMSHALSIEERHDGRGFPYYWLKFGRRDLPESARSDIRMLTDGYVTITPLKLDLTDHALQPELEKAIGGLSA